MKKCTKCNIYKQFNFFNVRKRSKDGYKTWCKSCDKEYHDKNRDEILSLKKEHYKNNKDTYKARSKLWNNKNQHKIKLKDKIWYKFNSALSVAASAKYRATKLQATPNWLTTNHLKQMQSLYKLAQTLKRLNNVIYHVDHIIPLTGENVSGLHVPWNLQILTKRDNLSKSNKVR
jgi:polyferredoxin